MVLKKSGVASGKGFPERVPINRVLNLRWTENTAVVDNKSAFRPGRYTEGSWDRYPGTFFPVTLQWSP